jgi:hypothetical protein
MPEETSTPLKSEGQDTQTIEPLEQINEAPPDAGANQVKSKIKSRRKKMPAKKSKPKKAVKKAVKGGKKKK